MREKISIKVNHRKSQIQNKLDKKLGFSLLLRDNDHQIVVVEKGRHPEKSAQDHTTLKEFKEEVRINLTQRTFVLFKHFKMNVFTKQIVDGNFQLKTSRVYYPQKYPSSLSSPKNYRQNHQITNSCENFGCPLWFAHVCF